MKNNRGVTLASLTVYIIVLAITIVILTFVSANFTSQISDVNGRGKISNESIKFYSYLISDIKSSGKILEFSDDYIRFDNDAKYTIKYLAELSNKERQTKQYEIYRNNVLISENIQDVNIDYDYEKNELYVNVKYYYGDILLDNSQKFKVGRGYEI